MVQLTEEEKRALYETIDFNEVITTTTPPKEVLLFYFIFFSSAKDNT